VLKNRSQPFEIFVSRLVLFRRLRTEITIAFLFLHFPAIFSPEAVLLFTGCGVKERLFFTPAWR